MANPISVQVQQTGFEQSIQAGARAAGQINIPINATFNGASFNNLAQPLGKVTGLATEFEKSIAASNARVIAFGASVGIINGIQNAFANLVTTTVEVQKNLALIGAISNKSGQELEKFGDSLFQIAKNTGQSFKIAAEAATEFARQGLTVEETLRRTSDALTLTRFTSLSAADSVDVLTAAVNSFSDAGVTTADILNKLVAVDTKFAVSAADLANGLSRAGSIAREVGVSLDELNGIVTSVQQSTARGGAVIGNAFKTIFTNIRSENTIKALQEIGIYSTEASGKLKPVVPILQELAEKLNNLSETKKIEVLESIASKYNVNVLSALLSDINKAEGAFQQSKTTSAGATIEAYQRQLELNKSLSVAFNNVFVSSEKLANSIGRIGVTDNLKGLLDFFGNLIDSINDVVDSEGIGGNIARGLISGLGSIFFKVGIPVLAALFIVLTKNIIQFGSESLQTILGINSKVKERQALEQAVFNTLVQNQNVMANINALSGNRAKQEQYLLNIYNQQLAAIQKVRDVATSVAPGLQTGGLSAITGQITKTGKRAAGGYLPAQEAADVSRGVGGASSSSKVVSIPNFAFGGGKKGTMIANTSEYVVPNFANGGSAIFNQDMVNSFGLPAGARKLSAAGGYVPNFAKYIYDSDRIPADKNATLKAILASSAKKNLLIAPAGAGKSTLAAGMGKFLTGAGDVANATEIDILSGAGRTKDGGLSKNLESIMAAVNASGGKVSYLYTKNFDILSRRAGRTDPSEGDLRSKKQLAGTSYAPLNQFDFMGILKSKANSFGMVRGAEGYIPNFAKEYNKNGMYAGLFAQEELKKKPIETLAVDSETGKASSNPNKKEGKNKVDVDVLSFPAKSNAKVGGVDLIRKEIEEQGQKFAVNYAMQFAQAFNPDAKPNIEAVTKRAKEANINKGAVQAFVGTTFEAGVAGILKSEDFTKSQARSALSPFDFEATDEIRNAFNIPKEVKFIETKNQQNDSNLRSIAEKIYRIEKSKETKNELSPLQDKKFDYLDDASRSNGKRKARAYEGKDGKYYIEKKLDKFEVTSERPTVSEKDDRNFQFGKIKYEKTAARSASGYIPNFAQGGPLEDAVKREIDAGVDPTTIRVTKAGRLKNAQNPSGLAVINTRDEPDGKVPNFADPISLPGAKTFGKEVVSLMSGPTQMELPTKELAALRKQLNALIAVYEAEVKNGGDLNNAKQKLAQETKNLTNQYSLDSKTTSKVQGAVEKSASKIDASKGQKEQTLDIGKFLIFQTALAGATGAIQSFTKEGSNASMALEAAAGLANVTGTVMMVLKSGLGPIGIGLTVATTAITALGPVLFKFIDSFDTEGDKAVETLGELARQAKKTGQQLTPEVLLASLSKKSKEEEEKKKGDSIESQIEKYVKEKNIVGDAGRLTSNISSDQVGSISSFLQATGGVDKDGNVSPAALENLLTTSLKTGTKKISNDNLTSEGKRLVAAAVEKRRGSVAQKEGMTDEEKANQTYDSKQLVFRQKILEGIFSQELEISNEAAKTALVRERELSGLDKMKGRITELAAIEKERQIELRKITDEQEKFNSLQLNSVKKALGAGAENSVLSQEALSKADPKELLALLFDYEKSAGTEGGAKDFQEKVNKLLVRIGALAENDIVDSGSYKNISDAFRTLSEQSRTQKANTTNQTAAVNQRFNIAKTNTTADKQIRTIEEYTQRAGGGEKYDELLNIAKRDLTISLLASKEKNKLSIDTTEQYSQTQKDIAQDLVDAEKLIFTESRVRKDAETAALKLVLSTNARVRQFEEEGKNAGVKYDQDGRLIQAESNYLDNLYSQVSVGEEAIQEAQKLVIQSRKNRRQAEVAAKNQKLLFDEDVKQIDSKILIAKAFQDQVEQEHLNAKASKELELESLNLARASGELAAQYNNLAAVTANEQTKISNQQAGEITSAIAKGGAYSGTSTNLREQARASILRQNLGGRNPTDVSIEEQANLLSGKGNTIGQNLRIEGSGLLDEAKTFQQILGQDTPKALADGLAEAMKVGLSGADNIGEALQNIAKSFLQNLQGAFLQSASNKIVGSTLAAIGGSEGGYVRKFAAGGMVTGGSGIRDDVPAMLSSGEYVMRKSAVQKYGAENIAKMNNGGIFLPGVRGGSAISGYDQLSKFANQTTTSGATDILQGTGSTAYANLEDQSARLSRFGLMNEDTIKGEVTSAQQQGLDIITKREAYRTQQRKAMQQQVISTIASAALAYGASKIPTKKSAVNVPVSDFNFAADSGSLAFINRDQFSMGPMLNKTKGIKLKAYGGMVRGFNNGGGPTDDIPALLMGGEYVMNRATTRKYGKQYLDSMNTGRARFADGGEVGMDATVESSDSKAKVDSKTGTAVNISINVSGSSSSTESQGQTSQGGVDYKKMGERIKAVVLETINEEKRLGGALRSR